MKVKLVKTIKDAQIGSIVECDEKTAKELIEKNEAIEYTEKVELEEKELAIKKSLKEKETKEHINKGIKMSENKSDKYIVGKAISQLAGKAVTGMSEGTAGDGGNLLGTAVAELMGIAMAGSKVYSKCRKIVMPDRMNAMKVPVDTSDPWIKATAPTPTNPAEGAQKTATKLAFGARTLTLTKTVFYVPLTDELLQDVAMVDGFVRQYIRAKLATVLDYEILAGGGGGYTAIAGDSSYVASGTVSATPTQAELYTFVNAIDDRFKDGAEWFISPALWATFVSTFNTSNNIGTQIIDVNGMKLYGKPVNVMPCLNSEVILGDFGQYTVVEPAVNDVISVSESIRFDYDETVLRLVHRGAGAATFAKRTVADSTYIAAFCEKA